MNRNFVTPLFLITILLYIFHERTIAGEKYFLTIQEYYIPEAKQGVAVDENHFYAIGTRQIAKYEKETGKLVKKWVEEEGGPIIHLDSGMILDGKLYCAHSNYPGIPMTSSIEVWDTETLEHIDSHSFGIHWGSCTWVDRFDGYWWAAFAHYDKWKEQTLKGSEWTTVVKFDDNWNDLAAWVYPGDIVDKFRPMSNSGGSWGPDGYLYCTGHDLPEVYVMQLPEYGSELEHISTISINNTGQGIAWDRTDEGVIYTIRKKDRKVVVSKLINKN